MIDPVTEATKLRGAIRDLHGARLHGFALVLVLGDRPAAARLTAEAFAALDNEAPRLRHPERAAAALRAEVLRRARRIGVRPLDQSAMDVLGRLGIDGPTAHALAAMTIAERAALIASQVERLGDEDVATTLAVAPARVRRVTASARSHYLALHSGDADEVTPAPGSITERIGLAAARVLGGKAAG